VIPKSGCRFSDKITPQRKYTIPKSGCRFSDKIATRGVTPKFNTGATPAPAFASL
jgi:hypothetical protein